MLKKATALLVVGLSAATWISCGATSSHYVFTTLPSTNVTSGNISLKRLAVNQ